VSVAHDNVPDHDTATRLDPERALFAAHAWVEGDWRRNVLLRWNAAGLLVEVACDTAAPDGVPLAAGPVLPGMPNLHSHAFQRAMSGLTELRGAPADSFWSWRTLMYRFANRLRPEHIEAIARHLYIEMLKAGYTSVCEFHYVHHQADGRMYADPAEHAARIVASAEQVGMGLTLLPVLYEYSGFGARPPLPEQQRFIARPDWILERIAQLASAYPPGTLRRYGVAPHSLRAVSPESLDAIRTGLHALDRDAPIHIHIAEQAKEVEDCRATLGARPVRWLLDHQPVDARWCLVHATHMSDEEYRDVAASGAVVGLCPTTEANLGDGFFDAARYLAAGGRWGIGSDSHVSISPAAELRWLEYGQRLLHRSRNVLAAPGATSHASHVSHVADHLYACALAGGAQAAARPVAGLVPGQSADFVTLDPDHPDLMARPSDTWLAGLIFSEHGAAPIRDVTVAGRLRIRAGRHADEERAWMDYRAALTELLA
jgi:formimidoylglutamate deiminase